MFDGCDFSDFWHKGTVAGGGFGESAPDDALIKETEEELGYKLPASYIALMRMQNGGWVDKGKFPFSDDPDDAFYLDSILGIGRQKYCLLGKFGSKFWLEEWEYPPIGIAFGETPSAGHEMFFFDYRLCGQEGEPSVVLVNQESDYRIIPLADNFEEFINKLQ